MTATRADLATKNKVINSSYNRLYPSLHTSNKLSDKNELQFNYSHRIRRPEDEEINPFPEYQDLRNVRVGNAYLKTEDIQRQENRKRTARIIYCGFTYNFGNSGKKQNGDNPKYDNSL